MSVSYDLTPPPQVSLSHLFSELNKRIASGASYQKVLEFAMSSFDLLIPYDRIGISVLEGEGEQRTLRLAWMKAKTTTAHLGIGYSAPIKGSSLGVVIDEGKPRILNDLIEYLAEHPNSESTKRAIADGIRASLTCPLKARGKTIGVIFFSSTRPNTYKDAHVETFLSIAEELSLVIDYGQLQEATTAIARQNSNLNMILHDLRSPLSVIDGFLRTAVEEEWYQQLDSDAKQIFSILLRNTSGMFDLLNELMEISRLDRQVDKIDLREEDLQKFCVEMLNFGRLISAQKKISFEYELSETLPERIKFDKQYLRRILQNLFSNAVKFSCRGSKIFFNIDSQPGRIVFSVKDEGPGIPQSEIPKLFKEFGKTSVKPSEGEPSTGLGLAIVKRLVERHGGEIDVKSQPGTGSTFSFYIPLN